MGNVKTDSARKTPSRFDLTPGNRLGAQRRHIETAHVLPSGIDLTPVRAGSGPKRVPGVKSETAHVLPSGIDLTPGPPTA